MRRHRPAWRWVDTVEDQITVTDRRLGLTPRWRDPATGLRGPQ